jgi:uncharacterized membrane protein YbhN (UPF0104 family)
MYLTYGCYDPEKVETKDMDHKRTIKIVISFLIVAAVSYFFFREFQKNWLSIRSFELKFNTYFVFLSCTAVGINYLLTTYGWHYTLNSLSGSRKLTYPESIAIVNTSNLTKYIPGKIWSYALQVYWLSKEGFSNSLVLYVYVVNIVVVSLASLMLGVGYLIIFPVSIPPSVTVPLLLILLMFDMTFIEFNSTLFKRGISMVNKLFNRNMEYFETPRSLLLHLHLIHFVSAFFFGMGAYLVCFGIGFDLPQGSMPAVMSSLMISDVIGFFAIIVPGGLGVREGVMYMVLRGVSSGALPLMLPIAARIVSMLADVVLGLTGFMTLKKIMVKKS